MRHRWKQNGVARGVFAVALLTASCTSVVRTDAGNEDSATQSDTRDDLVSQDTPRDTIQREESAPEPVMDAAQETTTFDVIDVMDATALDQMDQGSPTDAMADASADRLDAVVAIDAPPVVCPCGSRCVLLRFQPAGSSEIIEQCIPIDRSGESYFLYPTGLTTRECRDIGRSFVGGVASDAGFGIAVSTSESPPYLTRSLGVGAIPISIAIRHPAFCLSDPGYRCRYSSETCQILMTRAAPGREEVAEGTLVNPCNLLPEEGIPIPDGGTRSLRLLSFAFHTTYSLSYVLAPDAGYFGPPCP